MALPWETIGPVSGWAVAALLGIAIIRAFISGAIVPRATLTERITESRIKDQQIAELQTQNRHLREVGRTVDKIMRSIDRNAHSGDQQSREEDT